MHALRLLMVCRDLLATGELRIDMIADRAALLAVRSGEVPLAECLAWADRLRTDIATTHRMVPAEPDTRRVEDWLISVRRRNLDAHHTS